MKRIKMWSLTAVAVGLSMVVSACGAQSDSSGVKGSTITIGAISPISGSAASWGSAEVASMQLAVDKVNADGGVKVDGKTYKMKLATFDSAYDPTKAANAATKAISQDGIKFVESLGAAIAAAIQPIATRGGAVIFCSCTGGSFLGKKYPMTFRPYFDDSDSLAAMLKVLKTTAPAAKSVAEIYPDNDAGHEQAGVSVGVTKDAGYSVSTTYVDPDATDLYPVLTKVLASHPDAIDVGPSVETRYTDIVKQALELGYKGVFLFPDTVNIQGVAKAIGKNVAGLNGSLTAPCTIAPRTDAARNWYDGFKKKAGDPSGSWWASQSYDNVLLLAAAMQKANSLDPKKVADALGTVKIAGASFGGGEVSYGGADRFGLPRAFQVPYEVCSASVSGSTVKLVEH